MRIPLMALLTRGEFDAANAVARAVARRQQYDMALAQDKRQSITKRRTAVRQANTKEVR